MTYISVKYNGNPPVLLREPVFCATYTGINRHIMSAFLLQYLRLLWGMVFICLFQVVILLNLGDKILPVNCDT